MHKIQIALSVGVLATMSGVATARTTRKQAQPPASQNPPQQPGTPTQAPPPTAPDQAQPPPDEAQQPASPEQAQPPVASAATQSVANYNDQAQKLSSQPPDPKHPAEIKALHALADALDSMPGANDNVKHSAATIRQNADTLEQAPVTAVHSDTTKEALGDALTALDELQRTVQAPDMDERITTARASVDKIDPKLAFLKQRETIDRSFVLIGDALNTIVGPAVAMAEKEQKQKVRGEEEAQPTTLRQAREEYLFSKQFGFSAGGGYASFGAKGLRDITNNGGEWDARFLLGAHTILGAEFSYVGTFNGLNGRLPGVNPGANIVSNAFEGNFRLATPAFKIVPVQLFAFIGAGYNRFSLTSQGSFPNTSVLRGSDNTFVLPFGGGIQGNFGQHIIGDARFTYRAMFDENLLGRDHNADMYTVTFRAGYVF